jgi:(2Fe-2S) ferredoxin
MRFWFAKVDAQRAMRDVLVHIIDDQQVDALIPSPKGPDAIPPDQSGHSAAFLQV